MTKLGFILLFATTLQARASVLRCDTLFVSKTQLEKVAENLASFRIEITALKDDKKKDILLQEFQNKLNEFLESSANPEKANEMFSEAYRRLNQELKNFRQSENERERKNLQTLREEENYLQRWSISKKINISSYQIEKIVSSPDSSKLFIASAQRSRLLDANTLEEISFPFEFASTLKDAVFSTDGTQLITVGNEARIYDIATMTEIFYIDLVPDLTANKTWVNGAELSSDKTTLVVYGPDWFEVYDVQTKTQIHKSSSIPGSRFALEVRFSKNDKKLIAGRSRVLIYDLASRTVSEFAEATQNGAAVFTTDDGKTLKVWNNNGEMHSLDLETGAKAERKSVFVKPAGTYPIVLDKDQKRAVFVGLEFATVVDLETDETRIFPIRKDSYLGKSALTPDGNYLFVAHLGLGVDIYEVETGEKIFPSHTPISHPKFSMVTPDGTKYLVGDNVGNLSVWFQKASDAAQVQPK